MLFITFGIQNSLGCTISLDMGHGLRYIICVSPTSISNYGQGPNIEPMSRYKLSMTSNVGKKKRQYFPSRLFTIYSHVFPPHSRGTRPHRQEPYTHDRRLDTRLHTLQGARGARCAARANAQMDKVAKCGIIFQRS